MAEKTDLPALIARVLAPDYERLDNDLQCHEDAVTLAAECSRLQERVRVLEGAVTACGVAAEQGRHLGGAGARAGLTIVIGVVSAALEGIEVE